ncbi:MAG: cation transporter, partial [Chloroflexota bacterium]
LNLKSAYLHLMGDVLSTVAAVVAGILIRFTSLNWIDPLVSVFISLLRMPGASSVSRSAS